MSMQRPNRRSFLTALSALPGVGALLPAGFAAAPREFQARDVIAELGVRSFINAAGTFTALTGSLMRPEAVAAMQVASRKFVRSTTCTRPWASGSPSCCIARRPW